MEAIITNIQYFCLHDGPGVRTSVFFCGCPLKCSWCHNPECSVLDKIAKKNSKLHIKMDSDELVKKVLKDKMFYLEHGGVTCTGGEPLIQHEFLSEFLAKVKKAGITTAIESSLYADFSIIYSLIELVDLWIVDLKPINSTKHLKYTGKDNNLILENFKKLSLYTDNIWARMVIDIPQISDETDKLLFDNFVDNFTAVKKKEYIPYHSYGEQKYYDILDSQKA